MSSVASPLEAQHAAPERPGPERSTSQGSVLDGSAAGGAGAGCPGMEHRVQITRLQSVVDRPEKASDPLSDHPCFTADRSVRKVVLNSQGARRTPQSPTRHATPLTDLQPPSPALPSQLG
ncbi:hypothetical protein Krad_2473 [Kineococcus radiotolerans SRS30216 = ATCC BAA-149]|uniref:Uncharacterized protein n=1 Tax=Kineococcus radiotolerans (strain ATCC BAA-149 / DSM 14245 / SRS30216) TaxID=266940 RepID=A6WAW0_KINRD|nr:hypothetical protein Krad_2473 [Kineococcus radiotolerans SRS30216 = ATCC BAA-149]